MLYHHLVPSSCHCPQRKYALPNEEVHPAQIVSLLSCYIQAWCTGCYGSWPQGAKSRGGGGGGGGGGWWWGRGTTAYSGFPIPCLGCYFVHAILGRVLGGDLDCVLSCVICAQVTSVNMQTFANVVVPLKTEKDAILFSPALLMPSSGVL